jgi:hypothetical protein
MVMMTELDAEAVAAFLESEGFEVMVNADDAGGELPALEEASLVQVLVKEADVDRAKALLAEREAQAAAEDSSEEE